jgi:hypothetical protein
MNHPDHDDGCIDCMEMVGEPMDDAMLEGLIMSDTEIDMHYDEYQDEAAPSDIVPAKPQPQPMARSEVGQLLELAMKDNNVDVEKLERLVAMYERQKKEQARCEYLQAHAAFLAECPPVKKVSQRDPKFTVTKAGTKRPSMYADLDEIQRTVTPVATLFGLSYRWGSAVVDGGLIHQGCIVSHIGGHSETTTVSMPHESTAGTSPCGKYGAAIQFAKRYSLVAALGIAGCDVDDDGGNAGGGNPADKIDPTQAAQIEDGLSQLSADDRAAFLKWQKVESVDDIPSANWDAVRAGLVKKLAQRRTQ